MLKKGRFLITLLVFLTVNFSAFGIQRILPAMAEMVGGFSQVAQIVYYPHESSFYGRLYGGSKPWTLTISIPKARYQAGETVPISYSVTDDTGHRLFHPNIRFTVSGPNGVMLVKQLNSPNSVASDISPYQLYLDQSFVPGAYTVTAQWYGKTATIGFLVVSQSAVQPKESPPIASFTYSLGVYTDDPLALADFWAPRKDHGWFLTYDPHGAYYTFDASPSYDPDNKDQPNNGIVSYEWSFPNIGDGSFENKGQKVKVRFPHEGTYIVGLFVKDKDNNEGHIVKKIDIKFPQVYIKSGSFTATMQWQVGEAGGIVAAVPTSAGGWMPEVNILYKYNKRFCPYTFYPWTEFRRAKIIYAIGTDTSSHYEPSIYYIRAYTKEEFDDFGKKWAVAKVGSIELEGLKEGPLRIKHAEGFGKVIQWIWENIQGGRSLHSLEGVIQEDESAAAPSVPHAGTVAVPQDETLPPELAAAVQSLSPAQLKALVELAQKRLHELERQREREKERPAKQEPKPQPKPKYEEFKGRVKLNGRELKFDQPPVVRDGRLLVPLRAISEGLKAEVRWDPAARTVTVAKGGTIVVLFLDKAEVLVNGEKVTLDVPAAVVNGRTLVPLRFLNQVFRNKVEFKKETGEVEIIEEEKEEEEAGQQAAGGAEAGASVQPEAGQEQAPVMAQ